MDGLCAGLCGLLVAFVDRFMTDLKANSFFRILCSAFVLAFAAYGLGAAGVTSRPDSVVIGALMLLVPGLLFTNAMRDIIFGDTNSGINRVVQVILINGEDEYLLAQSGILKPGYQVTNLTADKNAPQLSAGGYEGKLKLLFYDPETGERAIVDTDIPCTVSVE